MTSAIDARLRQALRRSAVLATRAPSFRNTQPWVLVLRGDSLEVHSEPALHLPRLDLQRRQLTISCGGALLNARVGLAEAGVAAIVHRLPDPDHPTLLARVVAVSGRSADLDLADLRPSIPLVRIARLGFVDERVPGRVLAAAESAAGYEDTLAVRATDESHGALLEYAMQAEHRNRSDASVRADLRISRDGDVGADANPYASLAVLATSGDDPYSWLRAGEACQRLALTLAGSGCSIAPLAAPVEFPDLRARLRATVRVEAHPQVLIQIGIARRGAHPRRRRLVEMLKNDT